MVLIGAVKLTLAGSTIPEETGIAGAGNIVASIYICVVDFGAV
jgi:hypothetical protein